MDEHKQTTINADDYEEWFSYKCPYCEKNIMTLFKAYPGDWMRCTHCERNIKVISEV